MGAEATKARKGSQKFYDKYMSKIAPFKIVCSESYPFFFLSWKDSLLRKKLRENSKKKKGGEESNSMRRDSQG